MVSDCLDVVRFEALYDLVEDDFGFLEIIGKIRSRQGEEHGYFAGDMHKGPLLAYTNIFGTPLDGANNISPEAVFAGNHIDDDQVLSTILERLRQIFYIGVEIQIIR